ncbi:hypothetical protein GCM10007049_02780 [Echinicola pacifica]|uniref:Acetyltransferase (GNAT) domain-containing protein n=1 Tax=Echinicola pacifica TaxID=346377 RepID=A0A918PLK7_9BACT|nr:hypothetical protein [Echinicola pacifica]GGZ14365.1 hypothetical protein GCM10007049_02780 [Echinicola pacifica]
MNIAKNYEFIIQENPEIEHPYFLLDYQSGAGERYYMAKLSKKAKVKVMITFVIGEDKVAYSLPNAPFGGFWADKKVSTESLVSIMEELFRELKIMGVKTFKVNQSTILYEENSPLINYVMDSQGFALKKILLHHYMVDRKFIKGYVQAKAPKHKKKLKKLEYLTEVSGIKTFNFLKNIKKWRSQRGHDYKLSEERLIHQVAAYPERYHLVSVMQDAEPLAHALCVRLTPNSLYYFLPAIDPQRQQSYTGEALLFEVVRLGESLGVDFIDLGSSDLENQPNHNLIRFKNKYANQRVNKYNWEIEF